MFPHFHALDRHTGPSVLDSDHVQIIEHYMDILSQLASQSRHIATAQSEIQSKMMNVIRRRQTQQPEQQPEPIVVPEHVRSQPRARSRYRNPNNSSTANTRPRTQSGAAVHESQPDPIIRNIRIPRNTVQQDVNDGNTNISGTTTATNTDNPPHQDNPSPPIPPPTPSLSNIFTSLVSPGERSPFYAHLMHHPLTSLTTPTMPSEQPPQQPVRLRPLNFFDNVPVYPTPEEISAATRVVRFDTVELPPNERCPITLVPFNDNDLVMQIMQCRHLFNIVHLNGWFRDNVRCPVCRHDVREDVGGGSETEAAAAEAIGTHTSIIPDDSEMPALIPDTDILSDDDNEPTPYSFTMSLSATCFQNTQWIR